MFIKMFGAICICLAYIFYYQGGDTTGYYLDCVLISKTFLRHPLQIIRMTFVGYDLEAMRAFDNYLEYLIYSYDARAFFVDRICWPLCFVSFQSFIGTSLLLSFFCFQALWRLYQTLIIEFPTLERQMALSIFFIPSVVFWGSGILKDTITLASVAILVSSYHQIFKQKKSYIKNSIFLLISSYLILGIKPYIFFALIPGISIWTVGIFLSKVQNKLLKASITPIFILISVFSGYVVLRLIGNSLGDFRLDNVLSKAVVVQTDLKQDYYGGSTFDIGEFDPTVSGILRKAPVAIMAAIFRPYLWEATNLGMFVSGVENLVLLLLTIYLLLKIRVFNLFRLMFRHHFLFFSVTFSVFFAFSVGLTTSNFGSLVRYKIPAVPFFVASLFIITETYEKLRQEDRKIMLSREDKKPFVVT
jgi:hypothetical protein